MQEDSRQSPRNCHSANVRRPHPRGNVSEVGREEERVRSQPLWIIGAPRSGATFLAAVLNRHPMITLTNEACLLALLKNVIEVDRMRPDLLEPEYVEGFRSFLEHRAGAFIEEYFWNVLGVTTPICGDKHPPYADPAVLSGRDAARLHCPGVRFLPSPHPPHSARVEVHPYPAGAITGRAFTSGQALGRVVGRRHGPPAAVWAGD